MKALLITATAATIASAVTATLDLSQTTPISPLIYGYNQDHEDSTHKEMNLASRRLGGNRMSTFNWEENVENSGEGTNSSFCYIHGTILDANWNDQFTAGDAYRKFHQDNLDNGLTSIITVPILGWVAADKNRTVTTSPHGTDSLRWKKLEYVKGSPFSLTPDTSDNVVYLDESINYLVETFGDATTETGVKYISLGNEPALWDNTHELLQETPISAEEYVRKVIEASAAVKAVDPNVKIIVGEFAGINLYDFGTAPDWSSVGNNYNWFIDYLLDELKAASDSVGFDLIDILAVHNYPQHKVDTEGNFSGSGTVVRTTNSTDAHIRKTRMDFARSLWDSTYIEPSWITNSKIGGEPNAIIKRLQNSVESYFPGVKLMFGEIDYGFNTDISHGIAIADMLGVMGNNGVEIVNRWDLENKTDNVYTRAAYKLFRNYDGNLSTFGDQAVNVAFDNRDSASLWASINSETGNLHVIALNKSLSASQNFSIGGLESEKITFKSASGFDSTSSDITEKTVPTTLTDGTVQFEIPQLSAYHLVFERENAVSISGKKTIAKDQIGLTVESGNLHFRNLTGKSTVSIFSVNGRELLRGVVENGSVPFVGTAGIYFVRIANPTVGTRNFKLHVQ